MIKPYASYQPTPVEWLEDIPAHWSVRRLKELADVRQSNVDKKMYDGDRRVRLCNYTDVYYNDTVTNNMPLMEATATAEQIDRFSLQCGDVIVTKDSETADDIAVAALATGEFDDVVCGYHLALIRPHEPASGAFLKRYFDSRFAKSFFEVRATGQ